jgi:hypothetical protein
MQNDKEITAMATINAALVGLEAEVVPRVLRWVAERHKVSLTPTSDDAKRKRAGSTESGADNELTATTTQDFQHFGDLYDAADPSTDGERVLVAGYWFQVVQNQTELESQALNKDLKNLGHGVGHMPHAVDELMNTRPRLMIQIKKQGNTRQARRKFKLTAEGIKKVKEMLQKKTS